MAEEVYQPTKDEIAYHEAGHAVAHVVLDEPFDRVHIISENDIGGCVEHPPWTDDDLFGAGVNAVERDCLIDRRIFILMVGPAAQTRYSKQIDASGARMDRETIDEYSRVRGDSLDTLLRSSTCEEDKYQQWIWQRVLTFRDHPVRWAQIKAVAAALLENDELSADRVEKIVAKQTDKIMDD